MRAAVRLTGAAVRDAWTLGATVASWALHARSLCALRGHHWHVWVCETAVLVCDRCGEVTRAR